MMVSVADGVSGAERRTAGPNSANTKEGSAHIQMGSLHVVRVCVIVSGKAL